MSESSSVNRASGIKNGLVACEVCKGWTGGNIREWHKQCTCGDGIISVRTRPVSEGYCLYRHWDEVGRLLYVGKSVNIRGREAVHRGETSWWEQRVYSAYDFSFASQEALDEAEISAIHRERPLYNKRHNEREPVFCLTCLHPEVADSCYTGFCGDYCENWFDVQPEVVCPVDPVFTIMAEWWLSQAPIDELEINVILLLILSGCDGTTPLMSPGARHRALKRWRRALIELKSGRDPLDCSA